MAETGMGLRELKKQMTRETIAEAAFELAREKGPDLTVEEIAAAALVSPRTFSNYFTCKEEAIMSGVELPVPQIVEAVLEAPRTEPLVAVIRDAAVAAAGQRTPESLDTLRARSALADEHPALAQWYTLAYQEFEEALRDAVATRGDRPATDLHPSVVAAAVTGAIRAATKHWLHNFRGRDGFVASIDEAMQLVEAGLAEPAGQAGTRRTRRRATTPSA